jgi:hypothetical protein
VKRTPTGTRRRRGLGALRSALLTSFVSLGALGALALGGCDATLARPADFAGYRRYRLATKYETRLAAAWAYLRDQPRGEYRAEIEAWFVPEERRYFEVAGRSPGAAAAYLQILPDGPHADDERAWLSAWEKQRAEEPMRRRQALEDAQRRAEAAQRALGEAIERWTKLSAGITRWGEPLAQLDEAFLVPFREEAPLPTCDVERCRKHFAFTYPVPDATTARDRTVVLDVSIELSSGRAQTVELRAPRHGFDWWLEGAEARGVDPVNDEMRTLAVTRAKNRVEAVAREVRHDCTTQDSPTARIVDCGPVWFVIEPSRDGGDDVVRVVGL